MRAGIFPCAHRPSAHLLWRNITQIVGLLLIGLFLCIKLFFICFGYRFFITYYLRMFSSTVQNLLTFTFNFLNLCGCVWMSAYHGACLEVRGELAGGSFSSIQESQGLNSGCEAWQQGPLSTEPSPQLIVLCYRHISKNCIYLLTYIFMCVSA